ncbi:MAG TPA: hypothetical protein VJL54_00285 [Nitrososphaera sp.]|nr:hypothetical protein [Nitrososphaera sp.]
MEKAYIVVAIAAGLVAVLSAQQQSYAQYGGSISPEVTEETLQKCAQLKIEKAQCTESNVLLMERVGMKDGAGSGTAFIASETGQMVAIIGILGAVFGGVAGAFFVMGRGKQVKPA